MNLNTFWKLITMLSLWTLCIARQNTPTNGYDDSWFVPDIVTKKHDPADQISSNFGQPSGNYNWNVDQFQLMGRTQTTCAGCTSSGKNVVIKDLKLYVDDKEFFIKGMCYNPVPLGIRSMVQNIGGGGLCSSRRTPFATNDYKSACYDSDYFDGSVDSTRVPAGPSSGWFTQLWERDFPIIKSLGANTIRIYNSNPTTLLYTEQVVLGLKTALAGNIAAPAVGKDHRPFMNAASAAGLKVIFPLIGDQTLLTTLSKPAYEGLLMNQIDEIGNHDALLMYTVGNELPIATDTSLLQLVNHYIGFSRNYSMTKWGRSIPFTHAIVDNPSSYDNLYAQLDVDVFTSNAGYRGLGFSDLWTGAQTPGFSGLGSLSVKYNKPNFIGEMGWEQINGTDTANPINAGWFNVKWQSLIQNGAPAGCIGGAFFEYMDEPYSKADPLQQTMGAVTPVVSSVTNMQTIAPLPGFSSSPPDSFGTNGNSGASSNQGGTVTSVNTGSNQSGTNNAHSSASQIIAGSLAIIIAALLL